MTVSSKNHQENEHEDGRIIEKELSEVDTRTVPGG
jgi:hypothetical protein